jgi:hypothetical protein
MRDEPSAGSPLTVPPFVLTYEAPADCPGYEAFREEVVSHVRDTSRATNVRLNIAVRPTEAGCEGRVNAFDETGAESSRRIVGKTCPDVAHALAFLAGLTLELGGHLLPETPSVTAAPPPAPEPPPICPSPARAEQTRTVDISAMVFGGARGALGASLSPSGGAGIDVGIPRGILAPSGRFAAFVGAGSLTAATGSAGLWLGGVRLELCPLRFGSQAIVLRPCAGGEIGLVRAEGQIAFGPRTAVEPWISAGATVQVQWFPTRAWFLEVGGGPVFPLERVHYYFEPAQTVYVDPVLTARGWVGLGLRL